MGRVRHRPAPRREREIPTAHARARRGVGAHDSEAGQDVGCPPGASRARPNLSHSLSCVAPPPLRAGSVPCVCAAGAMSGDLRSRVVAKKKIGGQSAPVR